MAKALSKAPVGISLAERRLDKMLEGYVSVPEDDEAASTPGPEVTAVDLEIAVLMHVAMAKEEADADAKARLEAGIAAIAFVRAEDIEPRRRGNSHHNLEQYPLATAYGWEQPLHRCRLLAYNGEYEGARSYKSDLDKPWVAKKT